MKQSRHLFLNYSFPGWRRNQHCVTNWRKVGGRGAHWTFSKKIFIRWNPYLYLVISSRSSNFLFFLERSKAHLARVSCDARRNKIQHNVLSIIHPTQRRHTRFFIDDLHAHQVVKFRLFVRWRSMKKRLLLREQSEGKVRVPLFCMDRRV